jgi:hypothetical protein
LQRCWPLEFSSISWKSLSQFKLPFKLVDLSLIKKNLCPRIFGMDNGKQVKACVVAIKFWKN